MIDQVSIRRARLDDVDAMLVLREAVAAEGVWIGAEAPIDIDGDRLKYQQTIDTMNAGGEALSLVAVVGSEARLLGTLAIVTSTRGVGDLGMLLGTGSRGRGIGKRLMLAAIDWARTTDLHKLRLGHWPWNERAHRLYESVGFVEEGYLRRHYRRNDGSVWDAVIMGLVLDHERPGHAERATEPPGGWPDTHTEGSV